MTPVAGMDLQSEPYRPLPRYRHVAVTVQGSYYVWGGLDDNVHPIPATALEIFDGVWRRQPTTGATPRAVIYSAAAVIGNNIFHYGGADDDGERSNAIHNVEVGEWVWREAYVNNPGEAPEPARGMGMVAYRDQLIVVAGYTGDGQYTSDLRVFNTGNGECTFVTVHAPTGYCMHSVLEDCVTSHSAQLVRLHTMHAHASMSVK